MSPEAYRLAADVVDLVPRAVALALLLLIALGVWAGWVTRRHSRAERTVTVTLTADTSRFNEALTGAVSHLDRMGGVGRDQPEPAPWWPWDEEQR